MGDYFADPTRPIARKGHVCQGCLTAIPKGEKHMCQTGFYEGAAFRNRFHFECWDALAEYGEFEFTPGDCDPPERLAQGATP